MKELFKSYKYFSKLGLKPYFASYLIDTINFNENNIRKSPCSSMIIETTEMNTNSNNDKIIGVGTFLGQNDLCAIDIDGAIDNEIVFYILSELNLPKDYAWLVSSGSDCGYHIIFKTKNIKKINPAKNNFKIKPPQFSNPDNFGEISINAYYPFEETYFDSYGFAKIEFIWQGNIILPPSLHKSTNKYKFLNDLPSYPPKHVSFDSLLQLKNNITSTQSKSSDFGIFDINDDEYISKIVNSNRIAINDVKQYNFESNIIESALMFHLQQFEIETQNKVPIFMNQLCWFVLDSNFNIISRKLFNYYAKIDYKMSDKKKINQEISKKIIDKGRNVHLEFIFDLTHVKSVVCWDEIYLKCIKSEVINSGLYLDAFLNEIYYSKDKFERKIYQNKNSNNDLKPVFYVKKHKQEFQKLLNESKDVFSDSLDLIIQNKIEKKLNRGNNTSLSFLTSMFALFLNTKPNINNDDE